VRRRRIDLERDTNPNHSFAAAIRTKRSRAVHAARQISDEAGAAECEKLGLKTSYQTNQDAGTYLNPPPETFGSAAMEESVCGVKHMLVWSRVRHVPRGRGTNPDHSRSTGLRGTLQGRRRRSIKRLRTSGPRYRAARGATAASACSSRMRSRSARTSSNGRDQHLTPTTARWG
jgi:hypothetical protein